MFCQFSPDGWQLVAKRDVYAPQPRMYFPAQMAVIAFWRTAFESNLTSITMKYVCVLDFHTYLSCVKDFVFPLIIKTLKTAFCVCLYDLWLIFTFVWWSERFKWTVRVFDGNSLHSEGVVGQAICTWQHIEAAQPRLTLWNEDNCWKEIIALSCVNCKRRSVLLRVFGPAEKAWTASNWVISYLILNKCKIR